VYRKGQFPTEEIEMGRARVGVTEQGIGIRDQWLGVRD
jgi:hypothetical protein